MRFKNTERRKGEEAYNIDTQHTSMVHTFLYFFVISDKLPDLAFGFARKIFTINMIIILLILYLRSKPRRCITS